METKSYRVLIIERESFMRKYIRNCVLQCGNYDFVELNDFTKANQTIQDKQPLIIIFDIMQAFDHDITRIIESARNISADYIPFFIAVSSVEDNEKTTLAFDSGADFYLPKSFSNYHIRGILNSIIRLYNFRSHILENEGYYHTMFEKAGDAVLIVSLPEMDIKDTNPQTSRIYGYHKQELLAMKFSQLTEKGTDVKEKLLKKVTFLTNVKQKRKHGVLFPSSLAFAYFEKIGQPLVIITVKDLSEAERQQEEKNALFDFKRFQSDKAGREILAVMRGEQNERRRISREIHDHIGQQLVSIKLELENQAANAQHQTYLSNIHWLRDQMVSTISSLRKLSSNIVGDYLPHSNWVESVRGLIEHMKRKKKINIVLNAPKSTPNLSAFVQGHIYRIIEESLTNAIKHSESKKAVINIKLESRKQLIVEIISRGLSSKNESSLTPGIGMRIMQQRAKLIKSDLVFEINSEDEFIVQVNVPVND